MMKHLLIAALLVLVAPFATGAPMAAHAAPAAGNSLDNVVFLDLKDGRVTILLRPDLAPNHVARIKQLVREGFYNGLKFHRVIPGFMAQTGDPTGTGSGGSKYPDLKAEFTKTPFQRGTLGMARTNDPNTANSQFFICFDSAPFLNDQYTAFGQVIDGMAAVDKIKKGEGESGTVDDPDKIIKMQLASDVTDPAAKAAAMKALQKRH